MKNILTKRKLKELAPHEKEILGNELLKEKLIQKRLVDAIYYDMNRRFLKSVGGMEGLEIVFVQLREHGLTPEIAEQMTPEEFTSFVKEHNIETKKKVKIN